MFPQGLPVVIEKKIFLIRGQKAMLDRDLAELYGVTTRNLKRQVRRNIQRFPEEFMFEITRKEWNELVPIWHQFDRMKHSYVLPYVFTEHYNFIYGSLGLQSRGCGCRISFKSE